MAILRNWLAVFAVFATIVVVSEQTSAQQKPNVVFILADNVGYGDLGSYGGGDLRGAPTPRLDQLAGEGLRLTQFLVEPACTPSRAALMTGQYSIRNGLSLIAIEGSPYTLPGKAFTMGELFKNAGYATAIFGKWHLGSAPQSLPTAHGFDEFYGFTDVHPTGIGPQRQPGIFSSSGQMAGYRKVYDIEMDPHEDLVVASL